MQCGLSGGKAHLDCIVLHHSVRDDVEAALVVRAHPSYILALDILHVDKYGAIERVRRLSVVMLVFPEGGKLATHQLLGAFVGIFPIVVHLVIKVVVDSASLTLLYPVVV